MRQFAVAVLVARGVNWVATRSPSPLEELSERYHGHQCDRGFDFVYGGEERAEMFRAAVGGPGKRILDLGCRYGALTRFYLPGNEVVGLDVDRGALAIAAGRGIETCWADVEQQLPFDEDEFDVVVAGELLEHIREPAALLREAARVLRPGGMLVGSVPNGFRLKNRLRFLIGTAPEDNPTHLHLFSPQALLALLADYHEPELHFISSRFNRLQPRLMANIIAFTARRPASSAMSAADFMTRLPRSSVPPRISDPVAVSLVGAPGFEPGTSSPPA
jgi:SAM-dependent methyltransferase